MNMTKYAFMEQERAVLYADMNGTNGHEEINGGVFVFNLPEGLYFALELSGLPKNKALPFHIHEGTICEKSGEKTIVLPDVNSDSRGNASMQFYIDKTRLSDISGKVIMLHEMIDGEEPKIACGVLKRIL
ncbi:MAG: hypothetical protein J6C38_09505 [Oscillospiraceae bacterium]|nr:hypothetical protein [Oscillospiraceae bacterium]